VSLLYIDHVSVAYGNTEVVHDILIELHEGDIG
jgi:ABC-type branched-subunit amino acid transport system ATPase component